MKRDIKQIVEIAKEYEMSPEQRRKFGEYIHKQKRAGRKGSKENGDFTWDELEELVKEFLGKI